MRSLNHHILITGQLSAREQVPKREPGVRVSAVRSVLGKHSTFATYFCCPLSSFVEGQKGKPEIERSLLTKGNVLDDSDVWMLPNEEHK